MKKVDVALKFEERWVMHFTCQLECFQKDGQDSTDYRADLNWELTENFSQGKFTIYRFAAGCYRAELAVRDLQYSGYGYPQQPEAEPVSLLRSCLAQEVA